MSKRSNGRNRGKPHIDPAPVIKADTSTDQDKHFFAISLRYMTHGFNSGKFSASQLASLLGQLGRLSQLEWKEIYTSGKHGLGSEFLDEGKLNFFVPESIDKDHAGRPIALRCGDGKKAMVGKRVGDVFQLLCVECDYGDAYDHGGS